MPFGTVAQAVMAFHISLDALTVVVRKFRSVSSLMAEGSRLEGLVEALSTEHLHRSSPFSFCFFFPVLILVGISDLAGPTTNQYSQTLVAAAAVAEVLLHDFGQTATTAS